MEDRHLCKARPIGTRKQWVTGFYAVLGEKTVIIVNEPEKFYDVDSGKNSHGNKIVEVIPNTICQCTAMPDKNNKLIFENDIVIKHNDDDKEPYLIRWSEDYAAWELAQCGCAMYGFFDVDFGEIEVIGNAIDNPELLEV